MLETLFGRKNLDDLNLKKKHIYLVGLKNMAEEEQELYMVDNPREDMKLHGVEVVEMMKVATLCLQSDLLKDLLCKWWLRYWRVLVELKII